MRSAQIARIKRFVQELPQNGVHSQDEEINAIKANAGATQYEPPRLDVLETWGRPPYAYPLTKPLIGFKRDMESRFSKFPFESNVFLMMKFRDQNKELSDFIVSTLGKHGLSGIRADDPNWNITNNVYNPIAVLYCCQYGIALFDEPEAEQAYSPNVAYELAIMHQQNKNCLILRHKSLPSVPFDLVKDLYKLYETQTGLEKQITGWVKEITRFKPA